MQRTVDGKHYWTFEYELESPNFARSAFATIAIGNGKNEGFMFCHAALLSSKYNFWCVT